MGRLIIVQPGRAVIERQIALPSIPATDETIGVNARVAATRIEFARAVRLVALNAVAHTTFPLSEFAGTVYGITIESANEGQSVRVRTEGSAQFPGLTLTPNEPVFAGPDGVLVQDTTGLDVEVQVGTAISADTILIRVEAPVYGDGAP